MKTVAFAVGLWVALTAMAGSVRAQGGAEKRAQRASVQLIVDFPSGSTGLDQAQLVKAFELYLELPIEPLVLPPDRELEEWVGGLPTLDVGGARIRISRLAEGRGARFVAQLTYASEEGLQTFSFATDYPAAPSTMFYRFVALKVRTLLHVASLDQEATVQSLAAAEPGVDPTSPRVGWPVRWFVSVSGGLVFSTDVLQEPRPEVGTSAGVLVGPAQVRLAFGKVLSEERRTSEGSGEVDRTWLLGLAGWRLDLGRLFAVAEIGAGATRVVVQGRLSGGMETRHVQDWIPTVRTTFGIGAEVIPALQLTLQPCLDLWVERSRVLLQERTLWDSKRFAPAIRLDVRALF